LMISCSDRANIKKIQEYFVGNERDVFLTSRDHALRAIVSTDGTLVIQTWQDDHWVTTKCLDK